MNRPLLGLNKVPAAPSTRLPDHGAGDAMSLRVHCLKLRLAPDDRPEVPEVVEEQ